MHHNPHTGTPTSARARLECRNSAATSQRSCSPPPRLWPGSPPTSTSSRTPTTTPSSPPSTPSAAASSPSWDEFVALKLGLFQPCNLVSQYIYIFRVHGTYRLWLQNNLPFNPTLHTKLNVTSNVYVYIYKYRLILQTAVSSPHEEFTAAVSFVEKKVGKLF